MLTTMSIFITTFSTKCRNMRFHISDCFLVQHIWFIKIHKKNYKIVGFTRFRAEYMLHTIVYSGTFFILGYAENVASISINEIRHFICFYFFIKFTHIISDRLSFNFPASFSTFSNLIIFKMLATQTLTDKMKPNKKETM